jgi:hypothetical protein
VTHYLIPGGPFTRAYADLAASGWKLNLQSAPRPGKQGGANNSKTKFSCPKCKQNAWGKPDLSCIPCCHEMQEAARHESPGHRLNR